MTEDAPKKIKHWFDFARNVSKNSSYRIQVGCIILKGNHPIAIGFNKEKYNKVFSNPWRKSIHAEASAIMLSGRTRIKNGVAYVYRETKDGIPGLARPCNDCWKRLKKFGIKRVYFSTDEYPYWSYEDIV